MAVEDLHQSATALHEHGNYKASLELFEKAAKLGDPWSMISLASMYAAGESVACNYDKAIEWEKRAFDCGCEVAAVNLGISYRLKGDIVSARNWFEKAVANGDGSAALELAKLYLVSDKELENVRKYSDIAISNVRMCGGDLDEARMLRSKYVPAI